MELHGSEQDRQLLLAYAVLGGGGLAGIRDRAARPAKQEKKELNADARESPQMHVRPHDPEARPPPKHSPHHG